MAKYPFFSTLQNQQDYKTDFGSTGFNIGKRQDKRNEPSKKEISAEHIIEDGWGKALPFSGRTNLETKSWGRGTGVKDRQVNKFQKTFYRWLEVRPLLNYSGFPWRRESFSQERVDPVLSSAAILHEVRREVHGMTSMGLPHTTPV